MKAIHRVPVFLFLIAFFFLNGPALAQAPDVTKPATPVKLIFIHHSTGENWLDDENGGLGIALRDNNYFVSDTNYGWNDVGDTTDIGHWWDWFRGSGSAGILSALYGESGQNSYYSRLSTDPGGQNEIVMFKSCFPNSSLGGSPSDAPTSGDNPLRGQDAWSEYMTVANAKGIYNDILTYFASRPDRLFIAITAPPLGYFDTDTATAANARAFNEWLVNDWLSGYTGNNVAVFDFYNVLTSNGGNTNVNDAGSAAGNHHRVRNGEVQHIRNTACDMSAYPSDEGDSHPSTAGNLKATAEFWPLLNSFYNAWRDGAVETPPAAPVLTINVDGFDVTISWSPVANIDTYTIYYVIFPDGAVAGSFDYPSTSIYLPSLWSGAGLCCAVRAKNSYGSSPFSNVEGFIIP
ncbi:MAG: hypothetical protein GY864_07025 [Desulfobacterales bacterium]|nr:hypothetical protein [Desulfobacterales bacterium]